jgi:MbtH protein
VDESFRDRPEEYIVVVNDEWQYSLWRKSQKLPAGWSAEGFEGPYAECLDHIEQVWVDMRPRSTRERNDEDTAELRVSESTD